MTSAAPSLRPNDLLAHADRLVRPSTTTVAVTDIDIRRSVSACYYALFHAITSQLAERLLPNTGDSRRSEFARSIDHHAVKRVSLWIARNSTPPKHVASLVTILRDERWLVAVSDAFLELIESRHNADYHQFAVHDEALAFEVLATSRRAIDAVDAADKRSEATAVWQALIYLAARVR